MKVWLKMPYRVRRASRPGPESWLPTGNWRWQALTGVDTGQVLSFESCAIGVADALPVRGRQYEQARYWQVAVQPHGVRDPVHVSVYLMHGTWEIPVVSVEVVTQQIGQ